MRTKSGHWPIMPPVPYYHIRMGICWDQRFTRRLWKIDRLEWARTDVHAEFPLSQFPIVRRRGGILTGFRTYYGSYVEHTVPI
jgi:hypothetical protein